MPMEAQAWVAGRATTAYGPSTPATLTHVLEDDNS